MWARSAILMLLAAGPLAALDQPVATVTDRYLTSVRAGTHDLDHGQAGEALPHFIEAFSLAPHPAHLPGYLVRHVLRDEVIMGARARLRSDPGDGARTLLGALEPSVWTRLEHRRALAAGGRTSGSHARIWHGVASLRASLAVDGTGPEAQTLREELELEAIEAFVAAHRLDPGDDRAYEGLIVWIPRRGCLLTLHPERIPADLGPELEAFRRIHCGLGRQSPDDPLMKRSPADLVEEAGELLAGRDGVAADMIRGILANHTGDYAAAARHLEAVVQATGRSFLPRFTLARVYQDTGRRDRARKLLEELERWYIEPSILHNLGLIHQQGGDLVRARAYYEKVLILHPGSSATRYNLAGILWGAGDDEAARAMVAGGLDQDPSNRNLQGLAGIFEVRRGRFAEALPLLERALQTGDDRPVAALALATARAGLGQLDAARQQLALLLQKEPLHQVYQARYRDVLAALVGRAQELHGAGRSIEALAVLDGVLRDVLLDESLQSRVTATLAAIGPVEARAAAEPGE